MKIIEKIITEKDENKEIKTILYNDMKLSSRLITKLKTKEGIKLNGESVTVRKTVKAGDILKITVPDEKSENIVPSEIEIDIVYEDEDILIVNKPYNMPTHPSIGHYENTLANAVVYYYKDRDFVFRAVNRLDRDTTGLVLIAKNRFSANKLCEQIKEKAVKKTYLAICVGEFEKTVGSVEASIARENKSMIKRIVSERGQYAKTDYEVLKYENGFSLVKLYPVTGRTHQIRVHMSYLKNPLFGDFIYGEEIERERTRLHCYSLEFCHPSTNEKCRFFAAPPKDFFISCDDHK